MTRETRIGLLVGLVFIVMFGLVLAEFTGKSGIQPTQTLADNGHKPNYQRQALARYEDFQPPPAVAPAPSPSPSPSASAPQPLTREAAAPSPTPAADTGPKPVVLVSLAPQEITEPPTRSSSPVPAETADTGTVAPPPPVVAASSDRVYVVGDKDTFIKIARKLYGPDHEGEYKKIMDANKATVKDASGLKKGMKLVIPTVAGVPAPSAALLAPAAPATRPAGDSAPAAIRVELGAAAPAPAALTPATAPASTGRTYVVQTGDTASKLARKFLGSDSKTNVDKILKSAKLDAPEKLRAGVTLEIPS